MSTQVGMPADQSEQLRQVGLSCASTITCHLDAWRSTAQWLIKLPLCQAIETTDDAHDPNLRDGCWIVDPRSPEYHRFYFYDNHVEDERIFGPNCRSLSNGWQAAAYRFRQRPEDCSIDFGIDDAKRFALLAALILNRDFDGAALGLDWPWEHPEGCDSTFEGRGWAWARITTSVREEALLLELIKMAKMAIDYLKALPSMWKMSPIGEPSGDGSAADTEPPQWDDSLRELHFRGQCCKQYRRPAENQITILETFEIENWPRRIDDPLPFKAGMDQKHRLRETVRSMNNGLKHLRFECDGTGEGVIWKQAS